MDLDIIEYESAKKVKKARKLKSAMSNIGTVGYLKPKKSVKRESTVLAKKFGVQMKQEFSGILGNMASNLKHNAVKIAQKENKYKFRV